MSFTENKEGSHGNLWRKGQALFECQLISSQSVPLDRFLLLVEPKIRNAESEPRSDVASGRRKVIEDAGCSPGLRPQEHFQVP